VGWNENRTEKRVAFQSEDSGEKMEIRKGKLIDLQIDAAWGAQTQIRGLESGLRPDSRSLFLALLSILILQTSGALHSN
jgi:hypothetical protein